MSLDPPAWSDTRSLTTIRLESREYLPLSSFTKCEMVIRTTTLSRVVDPRLMRSPLHPPLADLDPTMSWVLVSLEWDIPLILILESNNSSVWDLVANIFRHSSAETDITLSLAMYSAGYKSDRMILDSQWRSSVVIMMLHCNIVITASVGLYII